MASGDSYVERCAVMAALLIDYVVRLILKQTVYVSQRDVVSYIKANDCKHTGGPIVKRCPLLYGNATPGHAKSRRNDIAKWLAGI